MSNIDPLANNQKPVLPPPPPKKQKIENVELAQRSRFETGRMREYKNEYAMRKLKEKDIRMNGKTIDKKNLLDFYASIASMKRRDVTVKDVMERLRYYQRYKIDMTWRDKQRFRDWIKSFAQKRLPKTASRQPSLPAATMTPYELKQLQKREERGARKTKLGVPEKFVSPKQKAEARGVALATLGISGVKDDFQRGHLINPASMGMGEAGKAKENKARGLGPSPQGGGLIRQNPGDLGANRVMPGPRKFL